MKISDIMIGDWVDVRNSADKNTPHIERITPAHLLRDEPCLGIPITPEILEKNGFQKGGSCYILYDDKEDNDFEPVGGYEIRFYPGNNFCSIQNIETEADISFYCEYIHQLQHAMRLCGITKEIKI